MNSDEQSAAAPEGYLSNNARRRFRRSSVLRNLLSMFDFMFVGSLCMAFTKKWQGLGDIAAKTIVIQQPGTEQVHKQGKERQAETTKQRSSGRGIKWWFPIMTPIMIGARLVVIVLVGIFMWSIATLFLVFVLGHYEHMKAERRMKTFSDSVQICDPVKDVIRAGKKAGLRDIIKFDEVEWDGTTLMYFSDDTGPRCHRCRLYHKDGKIVYKRFRSYVYI